MDLIQLLTLLIIAGICGSIAAWIVGYTPGGLLLSIIVGAAAGRRAQQPAIFPVPDREPVHHRDRHR